MKKFFALLALVAALVVTFTSCKPDDEIYNPQCKIRKIWYRSDVYAPNEVYNYDSKGMLTNITIDSAETFDFMYNKDKTVSRITHVGEFYTETIDLTYTEDRLVTKMVYTVDDTVRQEIVFTRDEETTRITKIEETYEKAFFDRYYILYRSKLYDAFMGDINTIHQLAKSADSKDLQLHSVKTITYAPGEKEKYENIESIVEEYPDLRRVVTRTFTYDPESFNPFYGLQFAYAKYAGYYVNNKLKETEEVKTAGVVTRYEEKTYSYEGEHYMNDKKYPRQFITISSDNNIPIHTYILYLKK
ncbi:MAG: hypothetical protein MJZ57_08380 [Bacteroidales bacterium]|nr:hypothetical protein [Bacteroidales bacterium]